MVRRRSAQQRLQEERDTGEVLVDVDPGASPEASTGERLDMLHPQRNPQLFNGCKTLLQASYDVR
jgi:hypothetical protein